MGKENYQNPNRAIELIKAGLVAVDIGDDLGEEDILHILCTALEDEVRRAPVTARRMYVSASGRVWALKDVSNIRLPQVGYRLCEQLPNRVQGYPHIYIARNKYIRLHRLLCETFHGPRPAYAYVSVEGDKMNPTAESVSWTGALGKKDGTK